MSQIADRLFVTDLDGTLLNDSSLVSPRSAKIISDLSRRGALITVATARTPATVEPLLRDTLTLPPAVVITGAALWSRQQQRYLSLANLPADKAPALLAATDPFPDLCRMVYTMAPDGLLDVWHNPPVTPLQQRFLDERSRLALKRINPVDDPMQYLLGDNVVLLLCMGAPDEIIAAANTLNVDPELSVTHYDDPFYPGVRFLEIFGPGVSKAEGVLRLKALTGTSHLTVFGDNVNDLPMMAVADLAVAVENARPEVKQAAHIVIGPNTDDAVPLFIADALS